MPAKALPGFMTVDFATDFRECFGNYLAAAAIMVRVVAPTSVYLFGDQTMLQFGLNFIRLKSRAGPY